MDRLGFRPFCRASCMAGHLSPCPLSIWRKKCCFCLKIYFNLMRLSFTCMCVCITCIQCPWSPEEDVDSPGIGVMDGHELPHGCWELSPGPLQEQQVVLSPPPPHWTTSPALESFLFREEMKTLSFSVILRTKWNVLRMCMLGGLFFFLLWP